MAVLPDPRTRSAARHTPRRHGPLRDDQPPRAPGRRCQPQLRPQRQTLLGDAALQGTMSASRRISTFMQAPFCALPP